MLRLKILNKIVIFLFIFVFFFLYIMINHNTANDIHSKNKADILRQNDTTLNKVKNTFISISQDYPINFATTKEQFKSIQDIFPGVKSVKSGQEKEYLDDIISAINCENSHSGSSEKTIVLVPYRDRPYNLKLFISPLHQHLMDQVR